MNELAEFDYNLQTPKMLHEQQRGIYGFHFPSPHSMRVYTAMSVFNTYSHTRICTPHAFSPRTSLAICMAFSIR